MQDQTSSNYVKPVLLQQCRVCLQTDQQPCLSPCNCKGSLQFIHVLCLKKIIQLKLDKKQEQVCCQICGCKQFSLSLNQFKQPQKRFQAISFLIVVILLLITLIGFLYLVISSVLQDSSNLILIITYSLIIILVSLFLVITLKRFISDTCKTSFIKFQSCRIEMDTPTPADTITPIQNI